MTAKPEPPYLLGIDLGTTNLKANLYDVHGRRVAAASRPTVRWVSISCASHGCVSLPAGVQRPGCSGRARS